MIDPHVIAPITISTSYNSY